MIDDVEQDEYYKKMKEILEKYNEKVKDNEDDISSIADYLREIADVVDEMNGKGYNLDDLVKISTALFFRAILKYKRDKYEQGEWLLWEYM